MRNTLQSPFPPVKVSLVVGFRLCSTTEAVGGVSNEASRFILPMQVHRAREVATFTIPYQTKDQLQEKKGKEFVTLLLSLPVQESFIQRK